MPEAGTRTVSTPDEPDPPGEGAAADAPSSRPAGPLGVARTPTGRSEVDCLLERLADADHLPAAGHTEVYEDVHRGLKDALIALDARPVAAPGPVPASSYDTHDNRS